MFHVPDRYETDVNVELKDFMPRYLKPTDRKRIKNTVKTVRLTHQIAGEEIPSVSDELYRCQVIQFYDIEIENIRDANFLASIYQNLIKPLCVFHIHDAKDEMYSLAIKRLSQNDNMQIVVEDSLMTQRFLLNVPESSKNRFLEYVDFTKTKNKQDKVSMYKEWFYKAYILQNEKAYANVESVLEGNFWYDSSRTSRIVLKYMELVRQRERLKKAVTNAERMKINKLIKEAIESLNSEEL